MPFLLLSSHVLSLKEHAEMEICTNVTIGRQAT